MFVKRALLFLNRDVYCLALLKKEIEREIAWIIFSSSAGVVSSNNQHLFAAWGLGLHVQQNPQVVKWTVAFRL